MLDQQTKDLLPEVMRNTMEALNQNTNATDEITLPVTLAVMSFATQGLYDGDPLMWKNTALSNYYCVLVPSGGLKTSISDLVLEGARRFEQEQRQTAQDAETEYQIAMKKYESEIKERARKKDDPIQVPGFPTPFTKIVKPKYPRTARYMASKFTLNGILGALKGVPHFGIFNSDAAEFFNSHAFTNRETSIEIVSALSRLWSGEQIDKLTGIEDIVTVGKRTTSLFMLQQELADFFVNPQFKDQGFTNRILITQSVKISKKLADFSDMGLSKKITTNDSILPFNNRIYELLATVDKKQKNPSGNSLLDLRRSLIDSGERDMNTLILDTFPICMTDNTRSVYQEVYNDMVQKMDEERYSEYKNFISRAYEHFVRMANTLAIFDGKDMVTEREALCACGLIYYFIDQRMNLQIDGKVRIDPIVQVSEEVLRFMNRNEHTEYTKRILNNYGPKAYRKLSINDRDRVLEEMRSRDQIIIVKDGSKTVIELANENNSHLEGEIVSTE